MEFILGLVTGVALGFMWGVWRATQSFIERIIERPEEIREIMSRIQKLSKEDVLSSDDTSNDNANDIRIEHHQGVVYLYDSNDEFLAQGNSISAALAAAEQRFPNRKFAYRLNLPDESNQ